MIKGYFSLSVSNHNTAKERNLTMSDYILSCCSTADISEEHFKERNINCVYFKFSLDGTEYTDDLGKTIPFDEFYEKMANGSVTKTSQPNTEDYIESFEPYLEAGKDIIHVCLSSGLSGAINSANIAKDILEDKYADRKIFIVDSLGASSGYGLLVDNMANLRDSGMTIEDLYNWSITNRLYLHHWFFSTDLTFYVKGGRISKTSGAIGGILGICPLLNMNNEGKLIPRSKIRTKNKVIHEIVKMMEQHAYKGHKYNRKVYISHSSCYEDARKVADLVEATFPEMKDKVLINSIGTTIGSHTGPGTVALFFWGDERTE